MEVHNKENYRNLIALSIEKALADIGLQILDTVQTRLEDDYKCTFSDCLDNPEHLNRILKDIFGNSYYEIVKSIRYNLDEFLTKEPVVNFLKVLQK